MLVTQWSWHSRCDTVVVTQSSSDRCQIVKSLRFVIYCAGYGAESLVPYVFGSHSQNNLLCTWSIVLKDEIWLYDLATFILHKNWYRCMHSHNKTRHFAALWKFTWHHNLFLFSYSIYRKENVKTDTCCICEGIRIPMPLLLNCVFQVCTTHVPLNVLHIVFISLICGLIR